MEYKDSHFSYAGLRCAVNTQDEDPGSPSNSLCYLVSLVDRDRHGIADPLVAKRIIQWLYETEEQADSDDLVSSVERFTSRYFDGGIRILTPCMVVTEWSPIFELLQQGLRPLVLEREEKFRATASGIWAPLERPSSVSIDTATTDSELFWAIISRASLIARENNVFVNVIAKQGYAYAYAIGSLPEYSDDQISDLGRLLWKRTVQG